MPARLRRRRCSSEVRRLACDTFVRVGCSGLARVDFFVEDGDRVLVNELNTMPGFTRTSVYPKLWEAGGLAFPALCDRLLALALERYRAERAGLTTSLHFLEEADLGDLRALGAGRELRDPDEVVAVAGAAGVELEALVVRLDRPAADLRPAVRERSSGAAPGGAP